MGRYRDAAHMTTSFTCMPKSSADCAFTLSICDHILLKCSDRAVIADLRSLQLSSFHHIGCVLGYFNEDLSNYAIGTDCDDVVVALASRPAFDAMLIRVAGTASQALINNRRERQVFG
jgi:hypothetical protein